MPGSHLIGNRFEISDPQTGWLGQGAMGQVYRGVDRWTGEPVAIKALKSELVARNPDIVARFEREGEALRQLNHPNIVKMLAAFSEPDPETRQETHYLVMEYVGGGSLRELLDQQGRLPVPRVLEIGLELADALARAHHLNIVHRDLKPDNVLLAEDGTPRLTDFGVARLVNRPQLTQTGMIIGTVHYLSPEACNGEKIDARADIWALGVLLFEMLSGSVPFSGESLMEIISAILTQPAPDLSQICPQAPLALATLIQQMLQKDPQARLPSARLVAAQLEAIQENRAIQTSPPEIVQPGAVLQESQAYSPVNDAPPPTPAPLAAALPPVPETALDIPASTRRNQRILLEKVKNYWISGVLEQAAPAAARLEIAKRSTNQVVETPWENVPGAQAQPAGVGLLEKDTLQIFQDADRSLLILGDPGAGKTISLLKLARSLIALAEKDSAQPVPVVLNLASWGEKRIPIADWITLELTAKYQIPRKMGRAWLEQGDLLLLLDDFDEIPARYLPDAIRLINQFRETHGLIGMVLASRTEAYLGAGVRLKLGGAVELQPLTPAQIDSYLERGGAQTAGLRLALRRDETLAKIAQSPLWLNVMSMAYQGEIDAQDGLNESENGLTDTAIHRRRLIRSYLRYSFQRRSAAAKTTPEDTTRILSWLAQKMEEHNQGIFLVEGIQPGWLPSKAMRWVFNLLKGLALGLTTAVSVLLAMLAFSEVIPQFLSPESLLWIMLLEIPTGFIVGGVQGWLCERASRQGKPAVSTSRERWARSILLGLVSWPVITGGLVWLGISPNLAFFVGGWSSAFYVIGTINAGTTYRNAIEIVEALSWSWKDALRGLIPGVIIGLIFTLLTALDDPGVFWRAWLQWSAPWALAFFLSGGLQGKRVEEKSSANQGIRLYAKNAIYSGGIVGGALGVFFWLFHTYYSVNPRFALLQGLMAGLAAAMYSGVTIFEHFLLRWMLSITEDVPLDLPGFLDEAAGLVLVRKVGGGYIFIHRLLMEYFTA